MVIEDLEESIFSVMYVRHLRCVTSSPNDFPMLTTPPGVRWPGQPPALRAHHVISSPVNMAIDSFY
eukprot:scaffold73_cov131-Skeletonema_dohrnii-CCMP3373.AAC.11